MKKISLIILLLMSSCVQVFSSFSENLIPLSENFELSESCPQLCWMGIVPGTMTIDETVVLLKNSDQIDQQSIQVTEYGLKAKWFISSTKDLYTWAKIYSSYGDDTVQSIQFAQLHPYTVSDFVDLLGEPNEISISLDEMDGIRFVNYVLYYPSLSAFFYINNNVITTGPSVDDTVLELYLYTNVYDAYLPPWIIRDYNKRQLWLGYGHLDEYLPGIEFPDSP